MINNSSYTIFVCKFAIFVFWWKAYSIDG